MEPKGWKAWPPYDALIAYLSKAPSVTIEIPGHGTAEFPAGMSSDEIAAVIKKKFFLGEPWQEFDPDKYLAAKKYDALLTAVPPDDLKKITLFDVGPVNIGHDFCAGFHGRVRNDLSRTVEKIGIKASFYDAAGQLIEVRTFWLTHGQGAGQSGSVLPNSPVSFEDLRNARVDHLPQGWKYQLEVIGADYGK